MSKFAELKNLEVSWSTCTRCPLSETRRRVVFGRGGVRHCHILFIGEGPGKSEDLRGRPFCGPSGKLFDYAMKVAAERCDFRIPIHYVINIVGCRPTDEKYGPNRKPNSDEILACTDRVVHTERILKPAIVVFLGRTAETALRRVFPQGIALRHPAYVLRVGGRESGEFRILVRGLMDVFRKEA